MKSMWTHNLAQHVVNEHLKARLTVMLASEETKIQLQEIKWMPWRFVLLYRLSWCDLKKGKLYVCFLLKHCLFCQYGHRERLCCQFIPIMSQCWERTRNWSKVTVHWNLDIDLNWSHLWTLACHILLYKQASWPPCHVIGCVLLYHDGIVHPKLQKWQLCQKDLYIYTDQA